MRNFAFKNMYQRNGIKTSYNHITQGAKLAFGCEPAFQCSIFPLSPFWHQIESKTCKTRGNGERALQKTISNSKCST